MWLLSRGQFTDHVVRKLDVITFRFLAAHGQAQKEDVVDFGGYQMDTSVCVEFVQQFVRQVVISLNWFVVKLQVANATI